MQSVRIRWTKETRGEPYAAPRSRHPLAYKLPVREANRTGSGEPDGPDGGILLHRLAFRQTTEGFQSFQDEADRLPMPEPGSPVDRLLPAGVLPEIRDGRLSVRLRYTPDLGKPVRTDGRSGLLEQTAFALSAGEYGRIAVNGRHAGEDGHVYELFVVNIAFGDDIAANFFTRREPDRRREWLESLW